MARTTIAYDDGDAELYPRNVLKQDKHYFTRDEYDTEGENGPSCRALRTRKKVSRRKNHFLHVLAKYIVERCIGHKIEVYTLRGVLSVDEVRGILNEMVDERSWRSNLYVTQFRNQFET